MSTPPFILNPSVLQLNETAPVKVTFLSTTSDGHFLGFYTFDNTHFADIRTLFGNIDTQSLIPNVSSVFLGNNRLTGKTPVFFLIKEGFHLNKHFSWFKDAMAGQNGSFKFIAPCAEDDAVLRRQEGNLVWVNTQSEIIEQAKEAQLGTSHPVLIFQTNDGKIGVVQGEILHSYGYGVYNELNPDTNRHATLTLEEEQACVVLNFIEPSEDLPLLSVRLDIGEKNFTALTRNRIMSTLAPLPETSDNILSAEIEISEEFEDTLYLEGYENQEKLPLGGRTFAIEIKNNLLRIKGEAPVPVYEALLCHVKIKTDSKAVSKIDVKTVLKTEKESFVRTGKAEILSQDVSSSSLIAGMSLPVPEKTEAMTSIFADVLPRTTERPKDDLPSFLTEMPSLSASASLFPRTSSPKTALITGGASQQGKIIAHALASKGYNILLHCHKSVAQTTRLVEELQTNYHIKASYVRADFSSYDETSALIASLAQTYGSIDFLVCATSSCLQEESAVAWQTNFSVNLRAVYLLIQSYVQNLAKAQKGDILVLCEEKPPEEFSSESLSLAAIKDLVKRASVAFVEKCRINALLVAKKNQENVQDELGAMTSFFADNKSVSGQIIQMDTILCTEKKR